jgi:hypothetical protein
MIFAAFNIVPFTCAICGSKFGELNGRKCSKCGKLACRHHFLRGWLKGLKGVCSVCLSSAKPNGSPSAEKK